MGIIHTPEDSPATAAVYERERAAQGFVSDHTRLMAVNPEAYAAWQGLVRAIVSSLGLRRYELVTLAAAAGARSRHCRLAHGAKALPLVGREQLLLIAQDHHHAGLSEAEVAMMDFARHVSTDAADMTDADTLRLREAGFSDREIVDITLAAAARNYYSRSIQALGAEVECPDALDDELGDSLIQGL
jgi:uncharacterized peroxidase-related enzyme